MRPADISVVIPTLNEEANIAAAVESARAAGAADIIVSDGGSDDETAAVARQAGATKLVRSLVGRGTQANSGAHLADGSMLLFLHADCRLDPRCLEQICEHPEAVWGAFRQQIDSTGRIYRLLERGNALRVTMRRMPFGDQAMFVRRDVYIREGGFPDISLMEDVELSKKLRSHARPLLLGGPVHVSARRWQQTGVIRQTLRNWSIQIAYRLGATPDELRKRYR